MTETATTPRRDSEGESRLRAVRRLARLAVVGGGMLFAGFVGTQLAHADSTPSVTDQLNKVVSPVVQAPMHVVEQADRVISVAPEAVQGVTSAVVPQVDTTVHNGVGTVTTAVTGTVASLHGELAQVTDIVGTLPDSSRSTASATAPAPHATIATTSGRHVHVRTSATTASTPQGGVTVAVHRVSHSRHAGGVHSPTGPLPVPSGPAQGPAPVPAGVVISPSFRHVEALRTLVVGPDAAWRAGLRSATTTASGIRAMEPLLAYGSSRPD